MVSELHVPIMVREVNELLAIESGDVVVDCTAGGGGHLASFLDRVGASGRVIALDRDLRAHQSDAAGGVVANSGGRATLVHASFAHVRDVLADEQCDKLFADLGVSSMQLDDGARGFSFREDAPLDMRMDTSQGETARELIERLDEEELADVIYELGDERMSRRIARAIKRAQPTTTSALAETVARAAGGRRGRIHPATRTFQALRLAVNAELDELDALLGALRHVVKPGGRAAILSFHSLEDGRVKRCFRGEGFDPLTKRPLTPGDDEIERNPRARSAKLRAAVIVPEGTGRRDDGADDADDDMGVDEGEDV
jgi:16S rRNA (cytosine1402-N4)-methyltransferase